MEFYRTVFGWAFTEWVGPRAYWLIRTGGSESPGIDGGLLRRDGPPPVEGAALNAYSCVMDVQSVDETAALIARVGGRVVVEKTPVVGIGWLAYAKDTEGNIFGFLQNDPMAM
jgi:predicted enzyme related to lactoylglutathione lyase